MSSNTGKALPQTKKSPHNKCIKYFIFNFRSFFHIKLLSFLFEYPSPVELTYL